MTDKNLLEDDIIDLTDLLEEGGQPEKNTPAAQKKAVNEPDSFDLGKEIAMDLDVSIEEIEQEPLSLSDEPVTGLEKQPGAKAKELDLPGEPLRDLESEIDLAIQDKLHEAPLTKKEEEVLLGEITLEESIPAAEEPQAPALGEMETVQVSEIRVKSLEEHAGAVEEAAPVIEETLRPMDALVPPAPEIGEPEEQPMAQPAVAEEALQAVHPVAVSTEAIVEAVVAEFRRDMPEMLEGIVRPVVKELLQEVVTSTRQALPGIVEKVIREEIERLKKL
ncbi:MAG TPA: hypothetical protein PLR71_03620 [Deltaproteobacteria bacterium]|nr:hypothetical protein [Deltaproteobacteria bacterium]HQI80628.1 hypothetical protein [Deltaproteobacteria bacterium]